MFPQRNTNRRSARIGHLETEWLLSRPKKIQPSRRIKVDLLLYENKTADSLTFYMPPHQRNGSYV